MDLPASTSPGAVLQRVTMELADARKILGLGPDDDPRPHLAEFRKARERIAEMVRTAPNETLALRYQQGLMDFDKALAAVREHLEANETSATPGTPVPPPLPAAPPPRKSSRGTSAILATLLFLVAGAGAGAWFYLKAEDDKRLALQSRLIELEREGAGYLESRHWPEAARVYDEIERLQPDSEVARMGRRGIEAGMSEEQSQFVGYWMGEARAALDAGRLDDAEAAARQVRERFPEEPETLAFLVEVAATRESAARDEAVGNIRALLEAGDWDAATAAADQVLREFPEDEDARGLRLAAVAGKEKAAEDRARARELYARALERDLGEFDQEALEWLREAVALAPGDAEIVALLEKMSAYVRTIRVPEDFATPAEAFAAARDRDRITIGAGVWTGPFQINAAVELQGAGPKETIFECDAKQGPALTIGPESTGAHASGITFQHQSFDDGEERFSTVLVRGGVVSFGDCTFADASGHGLLVTEGGSATAVRCRFTGNGWNGVAAMNAGSLLEVRDSEVSGNFSHGIEAWDGASVIVSRNRCTENSRNGIHVDGGTSSATIEDNQLAGNREFGIVLGAIASGRASGNVARGNHLGGIVVRASAAAVAVVSNQCVNNDGPGLVIERGLPAAAYAENPASDNKGGQLVTDVDLSQAEELPGEPAEEADAEEVPRAIEVEVE